MDTHRNGVIRAASTTERPLTARSVLASALLGSDPPEMPVAQLLRLAELFDINPNRARVALSRMVAAGEATTDGHGRYRLSGQLLARQARQQTSRAAPPAGRWDGTWWTLVLTGPGAEPGTRHRRRRELATARLGELREGVWMRPADRPLDLPDDVRAHAVVVRGVPDEDGAGLAARLYDLTGWAATACALLDRLADTPPVDAAVLAPGFVLSASVLRHLQADPLLPAALLPAEWPGEALREAYDGWDSAYRAQLAAWHRRGTP